MTLKTYKKTIWDLMCSASLNRTICKAYLNDKNLPTGSGENYSQIIRGLRFLVVT